MRTLVSEFEEIVRTRQPKTAEFAGIAFEDYQDRVESISKFSFKFQSLQVSKGIGCKAGKRIGIKLKQVAPVCAPGRKGGVYRSGRTTQESGLSSRLPF
jgi:hypothetical protein